MDDTDLVAEFTTEVTGKDLYDAITKNVREHLEDKAISVYIIATVTIGEDDVATKTYAYVHSDDVKRETYSKADDEWTWVREAIVDGKVVDLKEVGDGTGLSVLDDELDQNNWYELKLDSNGNVKDATLIEVDDATLGSSPHGETGATDADNAKDYVFCVDYTGHIGTGEYPKFVGLEEMVDDTIADNDTVILFRNSFTAAEDEKTITYKDGTLWVKDDVNKGFDVSPEVKTVLCLSDGEENAFDDVDDSFTGYRGLENAIRNLDSNFTGDLSVVFDKGSAVVIIFNDTTDAEDGDDDEVVGPAKIVGDEGIDTTDPTAPTLDINVYGSASVSNAAVKKYLEETFGGAATQKNGLWSFGTEDDSYEGVAITQVQVYKTGTVKLAADAANDAGYPLADVTVVKKAGTPEYATDDTGHYLHCDLQGLQRGY